MGDRVLHLLLNWEREGTCGRAGNVGESVGFVSETESLLACLKLT